MKNTTKLIEKVREILNTNKTCQDMMEVLVEKAKSIGMTADQFEQFKVNMMTSIIFKLAQKDEEIINKLGEDIWNELRKSN